MWRCDEEQSGCHGFGPCPKEAWPYGHNSTAPCVHDPHPSWVRLDGMSGGMGRPPPALSCALVPDPEVLVPVSFRGVWGGGPHGRHACMGRQGASGFGATRPQFPLCGCGDQTHPGQASLVFSCPSHRQSVVPPTALVLISLLTPYGLPSSSPPPLLQAPLFAALRRTRDTHWLSHSGTRASMMRLCTSGCGTGTRTPRKPWTRCG